MLQRRILNKKNFTQLHTTEKKNANMKHRPNSRKKQQISKITIFIHQQLVAAINTN